MTLVSTFDHYQLPVGRDGTPSEYYEDLRDEALATESPVAWSEAYGGFWVCLGWPEAHDIMLNPGVFSNRDLVFPPYGMPGDRPIMIVGHDEPAHRKYRRLVMSAFTRERAAAVSEALRSEVKHLIDGFIDDGRVDAHHELAEEVPARLMAIIGGLRPEDGKLYRRWVHAITQQVHTDPVGAAAHVKDLEDYFVEHLEEKRRAPGDDLMSTVINAEIDGERLTEQELQDFFVMLILGGIDTAVLLIASMFWRMAWEKELRRRVVRSPRLLSTSTDEFLRYYTPATVCHLVTEEVRVGPVTMSPGQHVMVFHPVVNRDPREFDRPDCFDPARSPNRHFSFGAGIHKCLGMHFARMEAQVCLEEFVRRIPDWELDPQRPAHWATGQVMGLTSVPITFAAGGGAESGDGRAYSGVV